MELAPADSPTQLGPTVVNRALIVVVYAGWSPGNTSSEPIRRPDVVVGKSVRADVAEVPKGQACDAEIDSVYDAADVYLPPRARCLPSFMPALTCAFVVVAQAAPSNPDLFVASIYANGREGVVWTQWLDGARRREWFLQALTTLWANCEARARETKDELGPLDFDVATNSQGMEVKSFTVKTVSQDASYASVVARLAPNNWVRKSGRENEIRYDLVWEHGRWKIEDVHSVLEPNTWSLRALLTQYLSR
jgi:hypothetical protein